MCLLRLIISSEALTYAAVQCTHSPNPGAKDFHANGSWSCLLSWNFKESPLLTSPCPAPCCWHGNLMERGPVSSLWSRGKLGHLWPSRLHWLRVLTLWYLWLERGHPLLTWFYSVTPPGSEKWGFRIKRECADEHLGRLGEPGSDAAQCFPTYTSMLRLYSCPNCGFNPRSLLW